MMLELATALFFHGEQDEAMALVAAERERRPTAAAHYLYALLSNELGRTDDWREGLTAAVAADETFAPAKVDLAVDDARRGDAQRAEVELRAVLADQPYFERAQFNLGTLMAHQQRFPEAEAFLARAVRLDPRYQEAWRALIIVQLEQGRRDAATASVEEIERMMPGSSLATEARGWLS